MVDLSKEIDFSAEIKQLPELEEFIKLAAKEIADEQEDDKIQKPELDLDLNNYVLLTGLPIVEEPKLGVFKNVLKDKILFLYNAGVNAGLKEIKLGLKPDGSGDGSAILIYDNQDFAQKAINQIDKKVFTNNVLQADFLKVAQDILNSKQEKYVEPTIIRRQDSQAYNVDASFRDQFVYREANELNASWFDYMEKKPIRLHQQSIKLDKNVKRIQWSPLGTYLICFLNNGFTLHAGDNFEMIGWFPHNKVLSLIFSPDESYIVSFNGTAYAPDRENFVVWEVKVQKKLRSFHADQTQNENSFKFSYDSKYIAGVFIRQQIIAVFELPDMAMLSITENNVSRKAPINVQNIQKFAWHTTKNILICLSFAPMRDKTISQSSTKVHVIEVPTRREIKWKSWAYEAGNGHIVVSADGNWVAVAFQKLQKKKVISTVVQVASFKKKDLQIDTVQEVLGKPVDITFDIYNNRFGVVVCKDDTKESMVKLFTTSFFEIDQTGKDQSVKKIGEITNQNTNKVTFSNNGLFFVLYSVDRKGNFTTGYIQKGEHKTTLEVIKVNLSHPYMTYLSFDPSGKYLLLGSEDSKSIQIWTVLGELVFRDAAMRPIGDVRWRPRLMKFLDEKADKGLFDDWKSLKKKYEELDDRIINRIKYEKEQEKKRLRDQFLTYITKKREFYVGFLEQKAKIFKINESTARTQEYQVRQKIEPIAI